MPSIDIVGGGVIGLSIGVRILEENPGWNVRVLAKEVATGQGASPSFASMWAGGHHVSAATSERELEHDRATFARMSSLEQQEKGAGLVWVTQTEYFQGTMDESVLSWYPEYERLSSLPDGVSAGCRFRTLDINVPVYLSWLHARFLSLGGTVTQQQVTDLSTLTGDVRVLAPGLGARELLGDTAMHAQRGQVVLVRAPVTSGLSVCTPPKGRETYVIPRGDGTVVCGGTRIPHDEDPSPRPETTAQILDRCSRYIPELKNAPVLAVNVGFRPARTGGSRLERQGRIMYAYGFGGWGYQASWGVAEDVLSMVTAALASEE